MSEKPVLLHRDNTHRLHCDHGPALQYGDGWGVWALHGVRVSQQIAETPADQMPIQWWADEKNVEVRHAIEKKIGNERILRELDGETIHSDIITIAGSDHPYELLQFRFPNDDRRVALRMLNPSTGDRHTEWVPPEISTVQEALSWRNGTETIPSILT